MNESNLLILKLNNTMNKIKIVNTILNNNYFNVVVVDPGDLISFLNINHYKILKSYFSNQKYNYSSFYNYFFRNVIKFSSHVIYKFKYYNIYYLINNLNLKTIGVHIRLGKYGDFHEKDATYFTHFKYLSYFNKTIRNLSKKYNISYIILSSDSSSITNIKKNNVIVVRNIMQTKNVIHSNNWYFKLLSNDSIECLLEMYMLSKSNYLVLTKNSAFSKVAYYMNINCNNEECVFL